MRFQNIPVLLKVLCVSTLPHLSGAAIYNGFKYYVNNDHKTWQQHEDAAVAGGHGHLASVSSSGEDDFIGTLAGNQHIWIGGLRTGTEQADFRWTDDTPWEGFTNWYGADEPNYYYGQMDPENCVEKAWDYPGAVFMDHGWNDARCWMIKAGVYKKPYGCCSQNFKDCDVNWCGETELSCSSCGRANVGWITGPQTGCTKRWDSCDNITPCCAGLTCIADINHSQCGIPAIAEPTITSTKTPSTAPTKSLANTGCCSQNFKDCDVNWCGETELSCSICGSTDVGWITGPQTGCTKRWDSCDNITPCCAGLTCIADINHSQCGIPANADSTKAPSKNPTSALTSAPITSIPSSAPTTSPTSAKITSPPTSSPISSPTSALTKKFMGQNFMIGRPDVTFVNMDGSFSLFLKYSVGQSASRLELSLFRENCTNTDNVSDVLGVGTENKSGGIYSKEVTVDSTGITGSPLVATQSKGYSAGTLSFCAKVEAFSSDGVSVTFLKSRINLSYDLTENTFEVLDSQIKEDVTGKSNATVDTSYGVTVCRCTTRDYMCNINPPFLQQNDLISICLRPDDLSKSATDISNFGMIFFQGATEKYVASEIGNKGPKTGALSEITTLGQNHRVVSRLVTALFEGDSNTLNVTGIAYLVFKTSRRHLEFTGPSGLSSVRGNLEGPLGKVPFEMNAILKKKYLAAGAKSAEPTTPLTVPVSTVGVFLIFAIVFVLHKKNDRKV